MTKRAVEHAGTLISDQWVYVSGTAYTAIGNHMKAYANEYFYVVFYAFSCIPMTKREVENASTKISD